MSTAKEQRISAAISGLVNALIPALHGEVPALTESRRDTAFELARGILESSIEPTVVADVNQAGDLIKKKLIRDYSAPERALQFSSLYTRLLTQPLLDQKWGILHFLYQLSESPHGSPAAPTVMPILSPPVPTHARKPSAAPKLAEKPVAKERLQDIQVEKVESFDQRQLLRDLTFALQGISSENFGFQSNDDPSKCVLQLPHTLSPSIIAMLHTLGEPALLYHNLVALTRSDTSLQGLFGQSLRAAIGNELRSYLTVLATLEGRIRAALASSNSDDAGVDEVVGRTVTLRRCVIWMREPTNGLRLLSLVAEQSASKRGGQLISLIHSLSSSHGDPTVGLFAERLLAPTLRPFYDMLRQWIYDGELSDPYHEFFVSEQDIDGIESAQEGTNRAAATSVWVAKYKLDNDMVPSIITQEFAQKIFLIGKSLNFIRYGCGDSIWVESYSKKASKELRYGDTATLETSIDEAYGTTMTRLMHLMDTKFHLFRHLQALKSYLLLGQGDFIALLMESLSANLDRPAGAQYRHTLTAQLEHAIKGSNAQFDPPEILGRLDARMLQLSHGDIGWDCFTLEYKIDAPIDVVVTEWGSRQYLKVFNFLWRIKRVQFALQSVWRKCTTGIRGVLQECMNPQISNMWKGTMIKLSEMIHFVCQLQHYVMFEVIESSWDVFQKAITKENCTLDGVIGAHNTFLLSITHKGLLGAKKTRGRDETFLEQLSEILKILLSFRDVLDSLYSWNIAEVAKSQEASMSAAMGRVTDESREDSRNGTPLLKTAFEPDFDALHKRMCDLSAGFRKHLCVLIGDLARQPDIDLRFMGVTMNFNDVYTPTRR